MENECKSTKKWLLILIAIYFVIGIIAVFKYGDSNLLGSLEKPDNDDVRYIRSGWTLLNTGKLTYHSTNTSTIYIMPGLTFTLAFFMAIFGKLSGVIAFRIFQVFLQAISLYLIFLIGRKAFNAKTGLFAVFIDILYMAEYFVPTLVLTETIFKFLLILLIYISMKAISEKKYKYYIWGGVIWGITCLFRPTIAAYPIVILVMWIVKKYKISEMIKYGILVLSIFCLIMTPWWIRNYNTFQRFILLTESSGNPFLKGTYINNNQKKDYMSMKKGKTISENNKNEIETGKKRLKKYVKKHPLQYVYWYTLGKTWYLWRIAFYWNTMFGIHPAVAMIVHVFILLTALYDIFWDFKKKEKEFLFLFIAVAFITIVHLPYFCFERYSYPIMGIMCIFSAHYVDNYLRHLQKNKKSVC